MKALTDLHRLAVGNEFVTPENFEHRFLDHPYGDVTIPVVHAPDGSLAGAVWIFPMGLSIAGSETVVENVANLHIHPKHRDTFAYTILSKHLQRTMGRRVPLHFSMVSDETYERQRDLDPESVTTIPWLIRIIDPTAFANQYGKVSGRPYVTRFLQLAGHMMFRRRATVGAGGINVSAVSGFDDRFAGFWDSIRSQYPITPVRSREYLSWRFANVAQRRYEIFVAETASRMLGYLVLRIIEKRQIEVGHIVDFVVIDHPDGSHAGTALLSAAERHCRDHDTTAMGTALSVPTRESTILLQAGFRANPIPQFRFLQEMWPPSLHCAVVAHDESAVPSTALNAANWFLTLTHHEIV
jgi:hypothetical protein